MTIQDRLDEIYRDLSHNVTFIYDRSDMLLAFDLVFHSVLSFFFQGKRVNKGWVEGLIVSDTRCGKSETAERMVNHYRLGEICSAENVSFAGLVGGMQQVAGRWHLTWGKIPINDRRLVVIDEVSGIPVDQIGLMSGIRSSGVAEIVKINTEKTHARTRLMWLSNPRSNIPVNSYNSGVEIVRRLIGRPEDIARYDFALIMETDEVDSEVINAYDRPSVQHIYDNEICHMLLLWVWSRKENQVQFPDRTVRAVLNETKRLCEKYSADFPLVTRSEMKIKLARMSAALAARLFSTEDGVVLRVEPEHVRHIAQWLDRIYARPCFSYDTWSALIKDKNSIDEHHVRMSLAGYSEQLCDALLETAQIKVVDVEEAITGSRGDAKKIVAELVTGKALMKKHGFYVKTPAFIRMLRAMRNGESLLTDVQEDTVERVKDMFGGTEL